MAVINVFVITVAEQPSGLTRTIDGMSHGAGQIEIMSKQVQCIGCGAWVPDINEEPSYHKGASPGCWAVYLEWLVKENEWYGYPAVHRFLTDCYVVQHPYNHPKTIRSLNVHLISLCCMVERRYAPDRATKIMAGISGEFKARFTWLTPPTPDYAITILNIPKSRNLEAYSSMMYDWADCVWNGWKQHHDVIRDYVNELERRIWKR